MSRYSQNFSLRCTRCPQLVAGHRRYAIPLAVAQVGGRIRCRCGRCGHEYLSGSQAARREWYWLEREQAAKVDCLR